MTKKHYSDEELISELQRFYAENGRVPTTLDMQGKFGYPSASAYSSHFGSHNKALLTAGFEPNQPTLNGTETCSYCGKRADEILNFGHWRCHDGIRYCNKHGHGGANGKPDYVLRNLDINSKKGLGRAGEILVVKTLGIGKEHDCNRESCNYPIDMYHKDYGKIDVKTSLLSNNGSNRWKFNFPNKSEIKTFICIGLSSDRSNVEHVWVVPNDNEIKNLIGLTIYDTQRSLSNRSHWEVDPKPYNDMWQTMKLDNCKIMVDKSKPKVKLTWEEAVKKAAEIRKSIELKSSM